MGVKLKEIRFEDAGCIYLAQNTEQGNKYKNLYSAELLLASQE
jgi:hypothetical protein